MSETIGLEQRDAAIGSQPCPDVRTLLALEAGRDGDPLASYWRTCQLCTHLMSQGTQREPWTGAVPVERLSAALASLNETLDAPPPLLVADSLARIVEHSADALDYIFAAPRRRHLLTHAVLPLYQIRDLDARSLAWLSRQPGDTISDKLGRRQQVLAPLRKPDINLPENRVARQLALKLAGLADLRLERSAVPPADDSEAQRYERMRLARRLGALANGPEFSAAVNIPVIRPNNALLADAHYRRVWQAWTWLAQLETDIERAWNAGLERLVETQFWVLVAVLCRRFDARIDDRLVLREPGFAGESFGIRAAGEGAPELCVVTLWIGVRADRSAMLRLHRSGDEIVIDRHDLSGAAALRPRPDPQRFRVRIAIEPAPARHARLALALTSPEAERGWQRRFPASNTGLRDAARRILNAVLWPVQDRHAFEAVEMPDWVGLDVSGVTPRMIGKDGQRVLSPAALAIGEYRVDGMPQRPAALAQHPFPALPDGGRWCSVPAALAELGRKQEAAESTIATLDQAFNAFSRPFRGPDGTRRPQALAIGVPTQLPLPAKQRLRRTASSAMGTLAQTWLIERAVAAALGWQVLPNCPARPRWRVIVVDCEAGTLTLTRLAAEAPETGGGNGSLYWVRDLDDEEAPALAGLTGRDWLADYLRLALAPAVEAGYATGEQAADIAERLIEQGEADRLGDRLATVCVPLSDEAKRQAVLWLTYDEQIGEQATARWMARFTAALDRHKKSLAELLNRWVPGHFPVYWNLLYVFRPFQRREQHRDALKEAWSVVEQAGTEAGREHRFFHHTLVDSHLLIARGCHEFLRRYNATPSQPTWRERQAEQSVEIEGDAHRLILMKRRLLGPGEEIDEEASETLHLPKGQRQYIMPVLLGSGRERSFSYCVMLRLPGLPLSFAQPVKLRLRYRYGDQDYRLFVRPAVAAGEPEPFPETEAELLPVLNTAPRFQASRPPPSWFEGFAPPHEWPQDPATAPELEQLRERARSEWLPELRDLLPPADDDAARRAYTLAGRIGALHVPPDPETFGTLAGLLDDQQAVAQNVAIRLLGRLLRDSERAEQVKALATIVRRMFARVRQPAWRGPSTQPRTRFHFVTPPLGALANILREAPGFLPQLQPDRLRRLCQFGADRLAEFEAELAKPQDDEYVKFAFAAFRNLCKLLLVLLQIRDRADRFPEAAAPFEAGTAQTYDMAKRILVVEDRFQERGYVVRPDPTPVAGQERDICRALYRFLAGHERQALLSYARDDEDEA